MADRSKDHPKWISIVARALVLTVFTTVATVAIADDGSASNFGASMESLNGGFPSSLPGLPTIPSIRDPMPALYGATGASPRIQMSLQPSPLPATPQAALTSAARIANQGLDAA